MMCQEGKKCCSGHWLAWVLVVIGGLNWGLVGLSGLINGVGDNWNVVHKLLGSMPMWVESGVYLLVGLATVWKLWSHKCGGCQSGESMK